MLMESAPAFALGHAITLQGGIMRYRITSIGIPILVLCLASGLSAGSGRAWKDVSVQVGDIKVHYIEAGTGDRNLLFIPGHMMVAEVWREQIPYFAARGFRVVAMDPRSQGLTSKTDGGNTYQQHAADLHAFLKKIKLEHCNIVAWAASIVTVLEYVSSPEVLRPDTIVFVNGGPGGVAEPDYPSNLTIQQARNTVFALQEDREKAAEALVQGLFKARQPGILVKELTDANLKTPTGAAVALLFDLVTADRRTNLASVSVPTLIVMSEERRLLGEYMQAKIQGAKLAVIPDVGHALFLEKPQAFNQALEDFLGKQ